MMIMSSPAMLAAFVDIYDIIHILIMMFVMMMVIPIMMMTMTMMPMMMMTMTTMTMAMSSPAMLEACVCEMTCHNQRIADRVPY